MAFYKFLYAFIFLYSLAVANNEAKILELTNNFTLQAIEGKYIEIAEDKSKAIFFKEAINLDYQPTQMEVCNFGFSNSSYWFKFKIKNTSTTELTPFIEIKNPNIDFNALFYINGDDTIAQSCGDSYTFDKRVVQDRYCRFPVKLAPKATTTFFLNTRNNGEQFHVPLYIGKSNYFIVESYKEQIVFGLYFGIVLFSIVLNIFFAFILKSRTSIFYVGYLIGLLFLQLSLTGVGFQYIWPSSIYIANHANPIFANASILFLVFFSRYFLRLKKNLPKTDRFLFIVSIIIFISLLCSFIPSELFYLTSVYTINAVALLLNIIILPVAYNIYKNGYKPARFFLSAFLVLVISVFVFILKNFGLFPSTFISEYGIQIGSAIEVSLLTLAVIDRFKEFKEEALYRLKEINELKTKTNIELEEKVEARTSEINLKKQELEEKNSEILSSIRYAQRIQLALLKEEEYLAKFLPNHFILFQPKDIVSGDFYWIAQKGDYWYLAVADCTGHGVPGGFLTMLGVAFLNEIVNTEKRITPNEILDLLREKFLLELAQNGSNEYTKDGMDISLVCIHNKTLQLEWAGANNPLFIIKEGKELIKLKPDKQPIGYYDQMNPFSLQTLQLNKGDVLYLFSDGYADQFGGKKGKKIGNKLFSEILIQNVQLDMKLQKEEISNYFTIWKGKENQIDDVCVVGIKV